MGDKTAKTIDYLRARLLAERSVSRTARQRAYELAKRVTELEKQLKFVTLQRKKAEKATADVLAILENHGRNDLSEPFDSSSDKEEVSSDFKDGKHEEASEHVKVQESDTEGFSCSEVESSSVNGRSLSWKSSKNSSSRYLEKKYMDASRRRRSLTSAGSSSRRVGKSCRQIRHREHRSTADGSQNDDVSNGHLEDETQTSTEGVRNPADVANETSLEGIGIQEDKDPLDVATSCNRHAIQNHGTEREMERALEHQAQFIAQYEAEEKAQREWEDKFRENNGSTPDSGDPGTHSDVTEERDESKVPGPTPDPSPPCSTEKLASEGQEIDSGAIDTNISQEPKLDTETPLVDQKNNEVSDNQNRPLDLQGTPGSSSPAQAASSSQDLYRVEQTLGKSYEPTLGPHEFPDKLGSVLEALQQAKLSLKQNLDEFPLLENRPSSIPTYRSEDKFSVPFSSAGLFRLPTDYEYLGTTRANTLTYDPRLSLTNYPTESSGGQFISSPYRERASLSRSASFVDDRFRVTPSFPYQETRPEIHRQPPYPFNPRLDMRPSALDPQLGMGPPALDPRLGLGSAALDPRLGLGSSARDPRLGVGMGMGPSGFDQRLGMGSPAADPRLEMGSPFTGDRYTRSSDRLDSGTGLPSSSRYGTLPATHMPLRARSLYDGYTRPNSFE